MPDDRKISLSFPNKKELVALFKSYGPWWMLAALLALILPLYLAGVGYVLHAVADLIRALHA